LIGPALQGAAALVQFGGRTPQENHSANPVGEQPAQCLIRQLPTGVTALPVAGLFVDNEIGGAVATGMGELAMKTLGCFLVVEFMRNGKSPKEACEEAVKRIAAKLKNYKKFQIGYLAVNKNCETGAYCIHKGFNYALYQDGINRLIDADYLEK